MAAASPMDLTDDYSCGYCLQRLSAMTDPRELPCSHVFCLPCLQADFRMSRPLQCTICGESHAERDLGSLPKVEVRSSRHQTNGDTYQQQQQQQQEKEGMPCDVCEDIKKASISFCTECDKKLCNEHFKMHELFLKAHRTIDISAYFESPTKYQIEKCPDHPKQEINKACTKCYRCFCSVCPTETICNASRGLGEIPHDIAPLEKFAQSVREKIREIMRSLSNKIAKTLKLEKSSWRSLDDVELKVREINQEVDRVTEEQITEIRRKAAELKEQIKTHLVQGTETVEEYAAAIMTTKEDIQDLWQSANHLVTHASDTEVIAQQQETLEKLRQAVQKEIRPCKTFSCSLAPTEKCRNIEMKFEFGVALPTSLKLSRGSDVNCYSVCWTDNNRLITCGTGNITLFDANIIKLNSTDVLHSYSIANWGPGYITMCYESNEYFPTVYTKDLRQTRRLESFRSSFIQQLSVNAFTAHVFAIDTRNGEVKIYGKDGRLLQSPSLGSSTLMGIHVLADGHVLVSDYKSGSITKYNPTNEGFRREWTCNGLESPTGMCSDAAGYIYVAGVGHLYILSEDGKVNRTLTHSTLAGIALYDVAISGDQIAIACSNEGVKTFQLC